MRVGDTFNETDSDTHQQVLDVREEEDPPVALCSSIKVGSSEETEQEYDLHYVAKAIKQRQQFIEEGYEELDVYGIYKLPLDKLRHALRLARQSTKGSKTRLRDRLMHYKNLTEVPSDCHPEDSDSDSTPEFVDLSESSESESEDSDSDSDSEEGLTVGAFLQKK